MLAESAWTRYTETQRQIGVDVPDYMPEGCPGIIVGWRTFKCDKDKYGPGIAEDFKLHVISTWTVIDCLYFCLQTPEASCVLPCNGMRVLFFCLFLFFFNAIPCVLITVGICLSS